MITVHSNSKFQEQFERPSFKVCHPAAVVQDEVSSSEISRDRVRGRSRRCLSQEVGGGAAEGVVLPLKHGGQIYHGRRLMPLRQTERKE